VIGEREIREDDARLMPFFNMLNVARSEADITSVKYAVQHNERAVFGAEFVETYEVSLVI